MKQKILSVAGCDSRSSAVQRWTERKPIFPTLKLAMSNHTVVMACRNLTISKPVQKEIMDTSNSNRVDLLELDVSSFDSIQNFCTEYKNRYPKLDILIHNAAYMHRSIY